MDIEKLNKTLTDNDHWFAIQREKARQHCKIKSRYLQTRLSTNVNKFTRPK